jgi:hypothetical protein
VIDFTRDFAALKLDEEVLVACRAGEDDCLVLARRHEFEMHDAQGALIGRRVGWQSTWGGEELPERFKPFAYAAVTVPAIGTGEEDYG